MRIFPVAGKPKRQARLAASRKPQAASRNISSNTGSNNTGSNTGRGGAYVGGRRRHDYKGECFVLSSTGGGSGLIWIKGWRDKAVRCGDGWRLHAVAGRAGCSGDARAQKKRLSGEGQATKGRFAASRATNTKTRDKEITRTVQRCQGHRHPHTYPEVDSLGRGPATANTGRIVRGLLSPDNRQSKVLLSMFFVYNLFLANLLSNPKHGQV